MQLHQRLCATLALIALTATPALAGAAGVSGNTYAGEVVLINTNGDRVPFDYCLQFATDGTVLLNASGSVQEGVYQESVINSNITLFFVSLQNGFDSVIAGLNFQGNANILLFFQDNVGNTIERGENFLTISDCTP